MKKLLLVLAILFAFPVNASEISDGAIVKTDVSPDIYIVKYSGGKVYKRLVLNPKVFESYQHLKWENVIVISQDYIDSFSTSDLVKVDGANDIYQLVPNGDMGDKHLITDTSGYDLNSVYIINDTDFNNYALAESIAETEEPEQEPTITQPSTEETVTPIETTPEPQPTPSSAEDTRKAFGNNLISQINTKVAEIDEKIAFIDYRLFRLLEEKIEVENHGGTAEWYASSKREADSARAVLEEDKTLFSDASSEITAYMDRGTRIDDWVKQFLNSYGINY